ncbi:unnamed protein product [Symbiodinium sp. CCMP2456]|nr:unnamed protein product [Symbiodinium sp. CCMP2456]
MAMQEEWPGEEPPWAEWPASEADPSNALKEEAADSEMQGLEEPLAVVNPEALLEEDEEVDVDCEKFDPDEKPEDVQDAMAIACMGVVESFRGSLPELTCCREIL